MTDSCADLSQELLEKHQIRSIPLQIFINNQNIHDGDLSIQELFDLVSQTGQLPKTSAPSIKEFIDFFSPAAQGIYIGISSQLSATIQTSRLALAELDRQDIRIIDSLNLSTGIGYLALQAADLRDAGKSLDEIAAEVQATVPKIRTSFIIDTMDYLYKGGRCTALQAIFGSMLKIRPVIEVRQDGTLGVKDKIRGARSKALQSLLDDFRANLDKIDLRRVFVTRTDCQEDAEFLKAELLKIAPIQEVLITTAGATIASHCGPGTIGILYSLK
jgi:DegV family protein with EDD domain